MLYWNIKNGGDVLEDNLAKRIVNGFLLALISFILIFWDTRLVALEILVLACFGIKEYLNLARLKGTKPSIPTSFFGVTLFIVLAYFREEPLTLMAICVILFVVMIIFIFRKNYHISPILDAGVTLLGILYCGFLFTYPIYIRKMPGTLPWGGMNLELGAVYLTFVVIANAATDMGSFFVGKCLGRHPLCPNISPGKTVEGAIGGIIFTCLFSLACAELFQLKLTSSLILGLLIGVFAILGDLWESLLKRDVAVKDSGNIIAGHGGILDRFDSLLFSAPVAFHYLCYITKL
jgi:phosphatidate cytidylyltransferase